MAGGDRPTELALVDVFTDTRDVFVTIFAGRRGGRNQSNKEEGAREHALAEWGARRGRVRGEGVREGTGQTKRTVSLRVPGRVW